MNFHLTNPSRHFLGIAVVRMSIFQSLHFFHEIQQWQLNSVMDDSEEINQNEKLPVVPHSVGLRKSSGASTDSSYECDVSC
mmetsp:Transcript_12810/g.24039  ORF Transcript_12810/g.24039 Transcript_12810/m.24039 type:complete len:81 (-) Transcript_12810:1517-1759(-)